MMPCLADGQTIQTIFDALAALSARHPERLAIAVARQGTRAGARYDEVSFAALERDASTFADVLTRRGIRRGMRTVVMITPGREFCAAVFGLLKLGAPPVFIDPGVGPRNIGACFRQAAPEAFLGTTRAQMARHLFGWGRGSIRVSMTVGSSMESIDSRRCDTAALPTRREATEAEAADLAAIAFTSGSTGAPKGVVFTHGQLLAQAAFVRDLLGPQAQEPHLATFPLFLLFGPAIGFSAIVPAIDLTQPATAAPEALVSAIEDYQCQSMFGSPLLVRKLGAYCRATNHRLSSLRRVLSAGAPSDPRALATLASALAPDGEIYTPYGATEALPVSNASSHDVLDDTHERTRPEAGVCVGRPMPGLTVRIIPVSEHAIADWSEVSPLPPGHIGEIAVSGAIVSPEYVNDPGATARAKIPCRRTQTLYHRMGDLGYFDERGRLWMCGRKSQRVVGRRRVYFTVPCERVFNRHEGVARTALVGIACRDTAVPVVCVELTRRRSARERAQIANDLRQLGAGYDHTRDIRHFLFHPGFPVDPRHHSKIRREALAAWAVKHVPAATLEPSE